MSGDVSYKLIATEPEEAFRSNYVVLRQEVSVGERDDFFWAEWERPEKARSKRSEVENKFVLLASRHHGYSLKDLSNLPLDVYVCEVKDPDLLLKESLEPADVSILWWALMLAPGDERENISEIYEAMKEEKGNVFYINPVHQ